MGEQKGEIVMWMDGVGDIKGTVGNFSKKKTNKKKCTETFIIFTQH